jgi:hypothetical protein
MSKAKSDFCIFRLQGNKIKGFASQLKLSNELKDAPRHNVVFALYENTYESTYLPQ